MARSFRSRSARAAIGLAAGILTVGLVAGLWVMGAGGGGLAQDTPVSQEDALRSVSRFLQSDAAGWHVKYESEEAYVLEDPEAKHSAKVSRADGSIKSFHTLRRGLASPQSRPTLTLEEAEELALGYVGRSGFAIDVAELALKGHKLNEKEDKLQVSFTSYRDEVELPVVVHVELDATSGELLDYMAVNHLPVRIPLKPSISRERAMDIAATQSGLESPRPVEAHLLVWPATWLMQSPEDRLPEQQALLWCVTVKGATEKQAGTVLHGVVTVKREVTQQLSIDAHTGDVRLSGPVAEEDDTAIRDQLPAEPGSYDVSDYAPAWSGNDMLYFGTTRMTRADDPAYERPERCTSIFRLDRRSEGIICVVADAFTYAPNCPRPSPDGSCLAFTYVRNAGLLKLSSGAVGRIGYRREGGQQSVWHPNGRLLVVTANRRGVQDLFRIDLDLAQLRSRSFSVLSQLEANQLQPEFGPAGTWLAFSLEEYPELMEPRYSVWVAGVDEDGSLLPPRKIAEDIPRPTSLSSLPDNQRLLICHADGPQVVDVETGERSPLEWPELHDPDLPGGVPLMIGAAALRPDGGEVAFSALRWSGKAEDAAGWYLYVCKLDGSGLQRLTPLQDQPVAPYVFPETGKTAFDVASDIKAKFER